MGLIVDMGGWNDSDLRFTGQEMADQMSAELAVKSIEKVRFLIFDSLSGDTSQLRKSTAELVTSFGESAKDSIVVVASKLDRSDPDELEERLQYMREVMEELSIGDRIVTWQSKLLSPNAFEKQISALFDLVDSTPPVATYALKGVNVLVQLRAKEISDQQEPQTRTIHYEVKKSFIKERNEYVPYEETYLTKKHQEVSRLSYEMEEFPFAAVVSYISTLGIRAAIVAAQTHQKDIYKQIKRTAYRRHILRRGDSSRAEDRCRHSPTEPCRVLLAPSPRGDCI